MPTAIHLELHITGEDVIQYRVYSTRAYNHLLHSIKKAMKVRQKEYSVFLIRKSVGNRIGKGMNIPENASLCRKKP
jgi:hypothetical protein